MPIHAPQRSPAFIAIDLKSFYASVECVERGLDPLAVNLVVADPSRTDKTICLAVSPSLKAAGVPSRPRLFEVVEKVGLINAQRRLRAPGHKFRGKSFYAAELAADPSLELGYIVAPPRMALYLDYSTRAYGAYLQRVAPGDIHVYSVDEVFIDAAPYLGPLGMTARELAMAMVSDVLKATGVTATAGLGPNLYLAKVAMDIVAKHSPPDANGVRVAELDEMGYRRALWGHEPLTDFWRVGGGLARRLARVGLRTMGDIARCSLGGPADFHNQGRLYKLLGKNAELLIDHAWGLEPCTMAAIKAYRPSSKSLSNGQVLQEARDFAGARLAVHEMAGQVALDLVARRSVASQVVVTIGYDAGNLADPVRAAAYRGEAHLDHYGRPTPNHAHGSANLEGSTSSSHEIREAALAVFDRVVDPSLLVRRVFVTACGVVPEGPGEGEPDLLAGLAGEAFKAAARQRERRLADAVLRIKARHGKNAILYGLNLEDGATMRQRNLQIGGHKA